MEKVLFIKFFMALFAIMNPFSNMPIFLSLTGDDSFSEKAKTAFVACFSSLVIMIIVLFFGMEILSVFGLDISVFRVAGGAIVFTIAFSMLHSNPSNINSDHEHKHTPEQSNPGFYPLAMPMMAGPGTIATVAVFSHYNTSAANLYSLIGAMIAILTITLIVFLVSGKLAKYMGRTGMQIVTRMMGMILAAIAVDMMFDGIKTFFL